MKRRSVILAAVALASATVAAFAGAGRDDGVLLARAFTISATAYPAEPAPGRAESPVYSRPVSSAVSIANAPPTAYGRSASFDPGTLELYTGPPPEDSYAECDVTSANLPPRAEKHPGGTHLLADCSARPAATASARGSSATGTMSSRVTGDGGGDALVAESVAEINNGVAGELRFASATFRGRVRADGRPGGASGDGVVELVEATFAGTPVTIGPAGMTVDEERVPIELVPEASRQLAAASQESGYSDVRVVQPKVEVDPQGTRAAVGGGGVFLYGTNNDPTDRYFLQLTLVGGTASVSLGGTLDNSVPSVTTPPPAGPLAAPVSPSFSPPLTVVPGVAAAAPPAAEPTASVDDPVLVAGRERHALPDPWRGWPWLLGLALLLVAAAIAGRRWTVPWWQGVLDRYLRG